MLFKLPVDLQEKIANHLTIKDRRNLKLAYKPISTYKHPLDQKLTVLHYLFKHKQRFKPECNVFILDFIKKNANNVTVRDIVETHRLSFFPEINDTNLPMIFSYVARHGTPDMFEKLDGRIVSYIQIHRENFEFAVVNHENQVLFDHLKAKGFAFALKPFDFDILVKSPYRFPFLLKNFELTDSLRETLEINVYNSLDINLISRYRTSE